MLRPWVSSSVGWSITLNTKTITVQFLLRDSAWVAGMIPVVVCIGGKQ